MGVGRCGGRDRDLVWLQVGRDARETKAHAQAQDFTRPAADLAVLAASVASLVAIGYTLIAAGNREGWNKRC